MLRGLFCTAFLVFSVSWAGEVIHRISVVGTKYTSPELVRVNCGLSEGEPFSVTKLDEAIKSIYALGGYQDVRILATPGPYGYDIEIRVVELPRVERITFDGNKKLKDKELSAEIKLSEGSFLSNEAIFASIKSLERIYAEKGMYGVRIRYEVKDGSQEGYKVVRFIIDEGKQKRVKRIEFFGNEAYSDAKLRRQMETKQRGFLRSGKFDPEKYRDDIAKIEDFYHKKGYITAEVVRDTVIERDDGLYIKIWVSEGKRYYFRGADVEGNEVFPKERLLSLIKLKPGDVFNQEKMDESIQSIYFLYTDEGYIHASVLPERQMEGESVFVRIKISEGAQAHVRLINIAGNTRTFEKVIRRELVLYPGDVFRRNLLVLSQRNVYFLNYFEDVVPEFEVLPNGDVDITLRVTEKPVGRFQIGAGYNAVDKLVGNISIGWPNVLGRGWNADLTYEFGKLKNNFSFSFTEPWFLDTPTSLGFDAYNTDWRWEGYYSELRRGGAIRLGRKLRRPRFVSVFARYKLESVEYHDIESGYVPSPAFDITAIDWPQLESSVMFTLERDSRDSRLFASRGSRNSVSVEVAGGPLGGQLEFLKLWLKSDWYFPLHRYLTLVAKCHYGALGNPWGNPDAVPFGERFFPGGISFDGQIRGYADRSIGPVAWTEPEYDTTAIPDAAGRLPLVVPSRSYMPGGRAVMVLTLELRVPVMRDQLYVAAFADAGNAWLAPEDVKIGDLKRSLGVGARFVVPMMGILGFDFAYGFDKDKPGWEVHFQIGPEF